MKKYLAQLWTALLRHLPGSELRRCHTISVENTKCIRHYNHLGRCEDAWRYRWHRQESL